MRSYMVSEKCHGFLSHIMEEMGEGVHDALFFTITEIVVSEELIHRA